jgi:hypothetical protein
MKKIAILCGLVAALLCLTQSAKAQYVQIHRDGARFVDDRGILLSNQQVRELVGEDVYFETVVGAQKQYRVGRNLIRGGAITFGTGLVSALGGAAILASSGHDYYSGYDQYQRKTYREREYDEASEAAGVLLLTGGYVAMLVGGTLLEVGIPIKIIGQSRLNWVENDFNDYSRNVSLHVGAAPSGVGLTLRF